MGEPKRAGTVGFVFQNFQLLPALTALENVMLPLELQGAADARTRAVELMEQVGLSHRLIICLAGCPAVSSSVSPLLERSLLGQNYCLPMNRPAI